MSDQSDNLTFEQIVQLEKDSVNDTQAYFKLYDNECATLAPELCEYFTTPHLVCQYNVLSNLLNEEEMLGICYWTELIDGGSAWVVHPIKCDGAKMSKDEKTNVYRLTAHSVVYDKVYEFDLKYIQYISHGPVFVEKTNERLSEIVKFRQYEISSQLPDNQDKELCFSERFLKEDAPLDIRLMLCEIFNCILLWEDFVQRPLDEKLLGSFQKGWLDIILSRRDEAKQTIQRELEELSDDEDYADTVEEINLIIDMLNNIDVEYKDILYSCKDINEILNIWPPILLPHPYPEILDFVAHHFRQVD